MLLNPLHAAHADTCMSPSKKRRSAASRLKWRIKYHQGAIEFWKQLIDQIAAEDGTAIATINDRIAKNEADIAALLAEKQTP